MQEKLVYLCSRESLESYCILYQLLMYHTHNVFNALRFDLAYPCLTRNTNFRTMIFVFRFIFDF